MKNKDTEVVTEIELHPKALTHFIRAYDNYWRIYSIFPERKQTILIDIDSMDVPDEAATYDLKGFYTNYCRYCPYLTFNLGNNLSAEAISRFNGNRWAAAKSRGCPGGKNVILSDECNEYSLSSFKETSAPHMVELDLPKHMFIVDISKHSSNICYTYMYKFDGIHDSNILISPLKVGNVDDEGLICWGTNSNSQQALSNSSRLGYDTYWGSYFNSDLTGEYSDTYYNYLVDKEYLTNIRNPQNLSTADFYRDSLYSSKATSVVLLNNTDHSYSAEFVYSNDDEKSFYSHKDSKTYSLSKQTSNGMGNIYEINPLDAVTQAVSS